MQDQNICFGVVKIHGFKILGATKQCGAVPSFLFFLHLSQTISVAQQKKLGMKLMPPRHYKAFAN